MSRCSASSGGRGAAIRARKSFERPAEAPSQRSMTPHQTSSSARIIRACSRPLADLDLDQPARPSRARGLPRRAAPPRRGPRASPRSAAPGSREGPPELRRRVPRQGSRAAAAGGLPRCPAPVRARRARRTRRRGRSLARRRGRARDPDQRRRALRPVLEAVLPHRPAPVAKGPAALDVETSRRGASASGRSKKPSGVSGISSPSLVRMSPEHEEARHPLAEVGEGLETSEHAVDDLARDDVDLALERPEEERAAPRLPRGAAERHGRRTRSSAASGPDDLARARRRATRARRAGRALPGVGSQVGIDGGKVDRRMAPIDASATAATRGRARRIRPAPARTPCSSIPTLSGREQRRARRERQGASTCAAVARLALPLSTPASPT